MLGVCSNGDYSGHVGLGVKCSKESSNCHSCGVVTV